MGDVIFAIGVALLGMFVGFMIGGTFTMEKIRERAIKSNAAHYVCDQTTGKCEFQFKGVE